MSGWRRSSAWTFASAKAVPGTRLLQVVVCVFVLCEVLLPEAQLRYQAVSGLGRFKDPPLDELPDAQNKGRTCRLRICTLKFSWQRKNGYRLFAFRGEFPAAMHVQQTVVRAALLSITRAR